MDTEECRRFASVYTAFKMKVVAACCEASGQGWVCEGGVATSELDVGVTERGESWGQGRRCSFDSPAGGRHVPVPYDAVFLSVWSWKIMKV